MKKSLYIILPLIGVCLSYLLVAFVKADANFVNWDEKTRFGTVILVAMFAVSFMYIAAIIINEEEEL
jgi:hypothetical protein